MCGPLVEFGNISYSVYLVHWPLIGWYKYESATGITKSQDLKSGSYSLVY